MCLKDTFAFCDIYFCVLWNIYKYCLNSMHSAFTWYTSHSNTLVLTNTCFTVCSWHAVWFTAFAVILIGFILIKSIFATHAHTSIGILASSTRYCKRYILIWKSAPTTHFIEIIRFDGFYSMKIFNLPQKSPNTVVTRTVLWLHLFPTSKLLIVSTVTLAWMLSEHCTDEAGRTADWSSELAKRSIHVFLLLSELNPLNRPRKVVVI